MYKNMRNYLIDQNRLRDGLAPSYFLEGMLHNVPNDRFGATLGHIRGDLQLRLKRGPIEAYVRQRHPPAPRELACHVARSELRNLPPCIAQLWNNWRR